VSGSKTVVWTDGWPRDDSLHTALA